MKTHTQTEVLTELRRLASTQTPVQLVETLAALRSKEFLAASEMEVWLHLAFPDIPVRVLRTAGAWHRVSDGGMSDEEFNALLSPYTRC